METKSFPAGRSGGGRIPGSVALRKFARPGSGSVFVVDLPEGARVSVPARFDADEVFNLLLVVREALR